VYGPVHVGIWNTQYEKEMFSRNVEHIKMTGHIYYFLKEVIIAYFSLVLVVCFYVVRLRITTVFDLICVFDTNRVINYVDYYHVV